MPDTEFMSLEKLAEKIRPLAGQVVLLYGTDLVRLHGVAEDSMDLYYITECRRNGLLWSSAVGGVVPLKERLGDDYQALDEQFVRDGIPAGPFQVVRSERLRKIWLEGEPAEQKGISERIQTSFSKELDNLDRVAAFGDRRRGERVVEHAVDTLKAEGVSDAELQSFRRMVAGHHAEAPEDAETGAYAYPLGALRHRQEVLHQRSLTRNRQQFRAIFHAARLLGYGEAISDRFISFGHGVFHHERLGHGLQNDLEYLCHEILDGEMPDYDEERDDLVLELIAREVPMLTSFLGIWLEGEPELTALWASRGTSMPVWWPAVAFLMANWNKYAAEPEMFALDDDHIAALRSDLKHCRRPGTTGRRAA